MAVELAVVRGVALRRWLPLALGGAAALVLVVVLTPRLYVVPRVHSPWFLGSAAAHRQPGSYLLLTVLLYGAAAALVACWLTLWRRASELGPRLLAGIAAGWSVPLLAGPPLRSLDVYNYAAVGRLALLGHDPDRVGPSLLEHGPFLAAVDPIWRRTPTPYGPLTVLVLRCCAAVSGTSVEATVLLIRCVTVAAAAAAVVVVARLAPPSRRAEVVALTALNPLVLLDLVSGAHLDVLVGLAALGVVVLAVRDRPELAMVLAVLAGMVKAPGFVLAAFVLFRVLRRTPAAGRVPAVLRVAGTALATLALCWLVLPDAFGWVRALSVPGTVHGWHAPSEWVAWVVHEGSLLAGHPLRVSTSLAVARPLVLLAGIVLALVVLARGTARPDLGSAMRAVGWAFLVVAVTGPVLYGWYLVWGLLPLAAAATVRDRRVLGALSVVLVGIGF